MYYLNRVWSYCDWWLFLRIEFICIIWTMTWVYNVGREFLRIEFICIIWTWWIDKRLRRSSWGLNLFVLFEPKDSGTCWSYSSWGLNLFVLFELYIIGVVLLTVLEDWIYLYYLNVIQSRLLMSLFLRIEFICIIWTQESELLDFLSSWGLNLFVLFEQ